MIEGDNVFLRQDNFRDGIPVDFCIGCFGGKFGGTAELKPNPSLATQSLLRVCFCYFCYFCYSEGQSGVTGPSVCVQQICECCDFGGFPISGAFDFLKTLLLA